MSARRRPDTLSLLAAPRWRVLDARAPSTAHVACEKTVAVEGAARVDDGLQRTSTCLCKANNFTTYR